MSLELNLRFYGVLIILLMCSQTLASYQSMMREFKSNQAYKSWDKNTEFVKDQNTTPFWRAKPKVYKKVLENRLLPVSVNNIEKSKSTKLKSLEMIAGALINAPLQNVFLYAKNYKNYSEVSDYVKELKLVPEFKLLYAKTAAFKYTAEFLVQTFEAPYKEKSNVRQLQWRVVAGVFKGMTVVFEFKDAGSRKTEISLSAVYPYEKLPLPEMFMEFGLEVIMQKAGERLRIMAEKHYSKSLSGASEVKSGL